MLLDLVTGATRGRRVMQRTKRIRRLRLDESGTRGGRQALLFPFYPRIWQTRQRDAERAEEALVVAAFQKSGVRLMPMSPWSAGRQVPVASTGCVSMTPDFPFGFRSFWPFCCSPFALNVSSLLSAVPASQHSASCGHLTCRAGSPPLCLSTALPLPCGADAFHLPDPRLAETRSVPVHRHALTIAPPGLAIFD